MIAYTSQTQSSWPCSGQFLFYSSNPCTDRFKWNLHCQFNKLAACYARAPSCPLSRISAFTGINTANVSGWPGMSPGPT